MDSFLKGTTLTDLIKVLVSLRQDSIEKIIYQKIHSDFLSKYDLRSGSGMCNLEILTEDTQNDFDDYGVPKSTSSWTRINNDPDGHCFYHSIWRFMVMTEHPKLTTFFKGHESLKPQFLSKPGWNRRGVVLLRDRIMDKYRKLKDLEKFMYSYEMARLGRPTPHFAGDIGIENKEYQLMANFLEIGIAIFTPKNNSPDKKSFWTFFCPHDETEGFCKRNFRDLENIAFIINSNVIINSKGNHFETLIPTPYNHDVISTLIQDRQDREHIIRSSSGGGQRKKNRKFSKNKRKSKQTKRKITNKNRL